MNSPRGIHTAGTTYTDKEARTLEELHALIERMKARGWVPRGPPREIARHEPGRLTDMRYAQTLFRSTAIRDP